MSVVERALQKLQSTSTLRSVRGQKQVARVKKRNVRQNEADDLGSIEAHGRIVEFNMEALSEAGLYSNANSQLADEYRLIKQPILRRISAARESGDARGNLVMVASALAGEGKTFTSVNLSLSLASEKDWKVLLVDVDCKNPQLARLLDVQDERGILDYLRDPEIELDSLIMPTNIDGLSILPLGAVDDHAAEYLGSSRMNDLCEHLSSAGRNYVVVFDSSPLLLTAESPILSSQVGQVVVVVMANTTPRQAVTEAISKLDSEKAIGLILNRADNSGEILRYGSNYGYGYPSR